MRTIKRGVLPVLLASIAVFLVACSSGSSATATPTAAATSAATSAPTSAATAASTAAAASTPSGQPIKLGGIFTLSGPFAQIGTDAQRGAQIAIKEINAAGGVMGRPLQLESKDSQLKPTVAVQDLRDYSSQGINLTFGYLSSANCLAVVPVAAQLNSLVVGTTCSSNPLTQDKYDPHFVRIASNDAMSAKALSAFVAQNFPNVKTWNVFGPDYITGHDNWQAFLTALKAQVSGITTDQQVFAPLSAQDYRSYISSMLSKLPSTSAQSEGLYLSTYGSGTESLAKQGEPFNFFSKFKVVINSGGFITSVARSLKSNTPTMWSQYDYYPTAFTTPMAKSFLSAYTAAYNEDPGTWAEQGYDSVYMLKAAIEKAGSTDTNAIIKVLNAGLQYPAIQGTLTIRAQDHQSENPVVIRHVVPDKTAAAGFKVDKVDVIPAKDVMPPVNVPKS